MTLPELDDRIDRAHLWLIFLSSGLLFFLPGILIGNWIARRTYMYDTCTVCTQAIHDKPGSSKPAERPQPTPSSI